jgi:RNA polymerase sigma-70 factor (ECF subfamily)
MRDDLEQAALRLESYRNYLLLLARARLDRRLGGKLDPADLVQHTLVRALEKHDQFRGTDEAQRAAWLRAVLANAIVDALRKFALADGAARSLEEFLEESSARLGSVLVADQTSPSERVEREEGLVRLADAVASLPEDQRRAVELKHLQGQPLIDVAREMGRSVPSVAGLLQRALKELRRKLGGALSHEGEDG